MSKEDLNLDHLLNKNEKLSNNNEKNVELNKAPSINDKTNKLLPYGFSSWKPSCLQCLNTIGFIVFFISIAHCLQNATNGILGVTISTLERRFSFTSFQSSLIASFYEVGQVPAVIFVMFYGHKVHRPTWMGIGMLMVLLGCLTMVLPKFLAPAYEPIIQKTSKIVFCQQLNSSEPCPPATAPLSNYLVFFIVGRTLIGVGATPILTIGMTYINDYTDMHGFALYSGIYNAMSIIGPGLGLVSASIFLKLYEDGAEAAEKLQLTSSDGAWVGNWWLSYIFVSLLIFFTVFPLFGYSDQKPGTKEEKKDQNKEKIENIEDKSFVQSNKNDVKSKEMQSDNPLTLLFKILKNPIFMLACLYNAANMFIIMGFNAFGPKVFENFLSLSPTASGLLFGAVLLPAGATGTILGGVVIKKFRMTAQNIIKLQAILSFIVLVSLPIILLHCPDNKFAGVNVGPTESVNNNCTSSCRCDEAPYQPVCSEDHVQYFSACHAGCKSMPIHNYTNSFSECSCLLGSNVSSKNVIPGACERSLCNNAYIFLPLFGLIVLIVFMCFTMNITLIFRCVQVNETTAAVSIQILTTKLLGSIPGPVLFGVALDYSCGLYNINRCSDSTTCLFIQTSVASRNLLILCFCVKLFDTLAMILMLVAHKKQVKKGIIKPEASQSV